MTTLYDYKGRPYRQGFTFYKDDHGRLLRVPSMFDPKERIMKYLQICFETGIGLRGYKGTKPKFNEGEIVAHLEEFWEEGERKMKIIMEMLDRRARELKEQKSIRHLIYTKTREILSKLTIPIFNRQQLENIPNMNRVIIDEISAILE